MLIGLVSKIGGGKDTVAQIVQELYPELNWQIKGFADKLRQVVSIFTGIPPLDLKYQEVKQSLMDAGWDDETVRDFMISIGMIFREKNENAWVNALMADYKPIGVHAVSGENFTLTDGEKINLEWEYPNWLITDCRFPNELEAITSRNGICIRIVRPDNPHPQSNHESETALDGVELLTIINDGSLDQLRLRVKEVFDPIVKNLGNAQSH